jgi:hypothetical protein
LDSDVRLQYLSTHQACHCSVTATDNASGKWVLASSRCLHPTPIPTRVPLSAASLSCRHNGVYVQTRGLMEQDLMDTMLSYLTRREQDEAPFTVYYAPHAIHQ